MEIFSAIVRNFNIPVLVNDRTSTEKISKNLLDLSALLANLNYLVFIEYCSQQENTMLSFQLCMEYVPR